MSRALVCLLPMCARPLPHSAPSARVCWLPHPSNPLTPKCLFYRRKVKKQPGLRVMVAPNNIMMAIWIVKVKGGRLVLDFSNRFVLGAGAAGSKRAGCAGAQLAGGSHTKAAFLRSAAPTRSCSLSWPLCQRAAAREHRNRGAADGLLLQQEQQRVAADGQAGAWLHGAIAVAGDTLSCRHQLLLPVTSAGGRAATCTASGALPDHP